MYDPLRVSVQPDPEMASWAVPRRLPPGRAPSVSQPLQRLVENGLASRPGSGRWRRRELDAWQVGDPAGRSGRRRRLDTAAPSVSSSTSSRAEPPIRSAPCEMPSAAIERSSTTEMIQRARARRRPGP
jgi:hypothetical protein